MSKSLNINDLLQKISLLEDENNNLKSNLNKANLSKLQSNFDNEPKICEVNFIDLLENLLTGFAYHEIIFDAQKNPIDCKYLYVNKKFEEIIGFKKDEIIGKSLYEIQPEIEPFWLKTYADIALNGKTVSFEHYSQLLDKYLEVNAYSPEKGKFITVFSDITSTKLKEEKIFQNNNALKIFGLLSNIISEPNDNISFFQKICDLIISNGSYKLCWIGIVNYDKNKTITSVAQSGYENGYVEKLNITWEDSENGNGPTGKAVRLQKPIASNNLELDLNFKTWIEEAKKHGFKSSASIPIFFNNKVYASLNIYSEKINSFQDEELTIFENFSKSISNGLNLIQINNELQKTIEELKKNEEKFKIIVENSPYPIALSDVIGSTKYVNQKFIDLFGYTIEEIPDGNTFTNLIFPNEERRTKVVEKWNNDITFIKPGKTISQEFIVSCKNNVNKNVLFTLININSETRILFFQDNTSIRNAITSIIENEENLRVTLNSIGDAVIVTDKNGLITRMNPVAQKLTGWSINKSLGKKLNEIFNIVNAITGLPAPNPVDKVLKFGKVVGLANHTQLISRGGKKYHIDDSAAPILTADGKALGVIMVFHDITEKYHLGEEIKETGRKLTNLISNLPGLVYRCINDFDWSMEYLSKGCEELTGYTPEEILNNKPTFNEIIIPEHREIVWENIQNNLSKQKPFQLTYKIQCKNNTEKWVWEQGSGVFDNDGNVIALEGFIYDITDEHLTNEALKESEYKFSRAFKSSPNNIIISQLCDGKIIEVNDRFLKSLEFNDESEVIGKTSLELSLWENPEDREHFINTMLNKGEITDFEAKINTKYNNKLICLISARTLEINNEPCIITIASDVTEIKKVQNQLIESEKRYSELLNGSHNGVFVAELSTLKFVYANNAICKMFGYSNEEMLKLSVNNIHPEKDLENVKNIIDKQLKAEIKTGFNLPCLKKNGKIFYADITASKQLYCGVNCLIGFFNDITPRKIAEDSFKKEFTINHALASLAKKLMIPTLSLNLITDSVLRYALNIAGSKFGFVSTIDHITGDNQIQSYSIENLHKININFQNLVFKKSNNKYNGLNGVSLNTKKAFFTNNLSENPEYTGIPEWHAKITRFLSVPAMFNDMLLGQISLANSDTDYNFEDLINVEKLADLYAIALYRKISDDELIKAKLKAEEADKLKTHFLENMSHEIRTPMNGIIGFSELLKENDISSAQKSEYIGYINNSCNVLSKLIDDIIDISKIEAGQIKIEKSDFSLDNVLYELLALFIEEKAHKNKNHINIKISKPETVVETKIYSDQLRFRQIIYNLLGNALKFTDKGTIEFGYKFINKKSLQIFVKDTGIGIPTDKLDVVFERFRQVDETPKRIYGGAGLGLAISKNLIEILGGTINVDSVYQQGTMFTINFNDIITNKSINENILQNQQPSIYDLNNKTILLVEDDEVNAILIKEVLKKTNARLLHSYDGLEAVKIFNNEPDINLVLMDIQLPGINGYEALKEIRKINNQVPIIANTAFAMSDEKEKLINAGFNDFIIKPINIEKLLSLIHKHL